MSTSAAQAKSISAAATQPRHILFLFDQLCNLDGGAERSLLKIIQHLPKRYRASIVTFSESKDPAFLAKFKCPVRIMPLTKAVGWKSLKAAIELRKYIKKENVSIVQTFFATSDLWGAPIAKLSGCPVIISSRRDMGFLRNLKHRIAYKLLAPMYDAVHTVSSAVRDYTIKHDHMKPERVITIVNGVDIRPLPSDADLDAFRMRLGLGAKGPIISDIGSVKAVKGYDVLAKAAKRVCAKYPNALFVIAGAVPDIEYLRRLQTLIEEMGLSNNFRFMGRIDESFPLLQISSIFCHLSLTDGLSNSLLEAMEAQLPCVISRVGGNPEVVDDGQSGFIVPPGDHVEAAERILELLDYPAKARQMGKLGRRIIETQFTAGGMALSLAGLYDELLKSKQLF